MNHMIKELAERHTKSFHDSVMHDHQDAMQCFDCEEMLEMGIKAFKTLVRVEKLFRDADAEEILEFTDELEQWMCNSYVHWMSPVDVAEELIRRTVSTGFTPSNLEEFRVVKTQCIDKVESNRYINASRSRLFEESNQEDDW